MKGRRMEMTTNHRTEIMRPNLTTTMKPTHRPSLLLATILALTCAATMVPAAEDPHDLVVYGGTSGGVVAAVQAARSGHSVVLISPTQKLGGLTASGLGTTDTAGYRQIIGGLAREFYQRIHQHYSDPRNWRSGDRDTYLKKHGSHPDGMMLRFEPHVTAKAFEEWAAESKITIVRGEAAGSAAWCPQRRRPHHRSPNESGRTFPGKMFIDASYEGDLLPERHRPHLRTGKHSDLPGALCRRPAPNRRRAPVPPSRGPLHQARRRLQRPPPGNPRRPPPPPWAPKAAPTNSSKPTTSASASPTCLRTAFPSAS